MPLAVILAAGNSSRMGSPKAILKLSGRTFLEIIISNLKLAGLKDIAVVLGSDRKEILENWSPYRETLIFNDEPQLGQMHSLRLAIRAVPNRDIMLCLVDQPLVKPQTYSALVSFSMLNPQAIAMPKCLREISPGEFRFKRGHPIIIPSSAQKLCLEGPLEKGLHWVTHHPSVSVAELEVRDSGIFKDFDTPQDYTEFVKNDIT
ncbi:MAG: hypothetical protein Fur0012_04730 [Elusimicrobiota bacterium]